MKGRQWVKWEGEEEVVTRYLSGKEVKVSRPPCSVRGLSSRLGFLNFREHQNHLECVLKQSPGF